MVRSSALPFLSLSRKRSVVAALASVFSHGTKVPMDRPPSAVIIVVDRLRADSIGPYGNTWIDTPTMNQLAAESTLIEHAISESPNLGLAYRSYWQGVRSTEVAQTGQEPTLMQSAAEAGLKTKLITDVPWLAQDALAETFDDCLLLRDAPEASFVQAASRVEETRLWQLFAEAAKEVSQANDPSLIWIHADGMNGPWSAPAGYRKQFVADGDPAAATMIEPPHLSYQEPPDPDELLPIAQAYAAEIVILDQCLQQLLKSMDASRLAQETSLDVFLTSPRGYALGEHQIVGDGEPSQMCLHAEVVNVPLLARSISGKRFPRRRQLLMQNADLHAALKAKCRCEDFDEFVTCEVDVPARQSHAVSVLSQGAVALRTPEWSLIRSDSPGSASHQLFAKPDDRFERNDVAALCPDVIQTIWNGGAVLRS